MSDFFEVGKTYTNGVADDPYKAPEQATVFRCDSVLTDPNDGAVLAVGWGRPGGQSDEPWRLMMTTRASWERGGWSVGDKWAGVV